MRIILTLLLLFGECVCAHAFELLDFDGIFISSGVTLGKSGKNPYIGGEASVFSANSIFYAGMNADCGYQAVQKSERIIIGPEVGVLIFGIDGGFLEMREKKRVMYGYAFRPYLTLPLPGLFVDKGMMFNIYYRRNAWRDGGKWRMENEGGIQIKCALLVSR
ncbi:MAG TPA: hypothetical protein VF857_08595 [Spirochaetota bacterium]